MGSSRCFAVNAELDAGFLLLAALQRAAVIEADFCREFHSVSRKIVNNDRAGMGAEAFFIGLFVDRQSVTIDVFIDLGIAPSGLGRAPFEGGEVDLGAIGKLDGGLDPVGPVVTEATEVIDDQMQFLGAFEIGAELFETLGLNGHFARLCEWFRLLGSGGHGALTGGSNGSFFRSRERRFAFFVDGRSGDFLEFAFFHQGQTRSVTFGIEIGIEVILGEWFRGHTVFRNF